MEQTRTTPLMDSDSLHFHIEIYAPQGLRGIEPFLAKCDLKLEAWVSGFNGQTILRLADRSDDTIEFHMDPSTQATLHASGYICLAPESAWALLLSLSDVLRAAQFPHWIGMDDDANERQFRAQFKCASEWRALWPGA